MLSNYAVKRMLPRLIVAAISVNISYYLCQIAIDISNIVGYSINGLLQSAPFVDPGAASGSGESGPWSTAIAAVLVGSAVAIGLVLLISTGTAGLLALALVVFMLLARQALIVLLVVVSPLAFVAYLLPNTESWFKKWWNLFWGLLVLFPVIGLIFGASSLAASILANTGDGMMQLMALGVSVIPLFAVPFALKGALSATGAVGAKLQGLSDKAGGRAKARMGEGRLGEARQALGQRRAQRRINRRIGKGPIGRVNRKIDNSRFGRYIGGDRGAAAMAAASSKIENEAVDNAVAVMQKNPDWTAENSIKMAQSELSQAIENGDTTKARAAQKILLGSGSKGIAAAADTLSRSVDSSNVGSETVQFLKSDITSAGLKGKDAALDQWSRDNTGATVHQVASNRQLLDNLTDSQLAGQSEERITQGGLSQQRAEEIMKNENVMSELSENKKKIIRQAASGVDIRNPAIHIDNAHDSAHAERQRRDPNVVHDVEQAHEQALQENVAFDLRNRNQP